MYVWPWYACSLTDKDKGCAYLFSCEHHLMVRICICLIYDGVMVRKTRDFKTDMH